MQLKLTESRLPFAPLLLIAPFFLWGTAMVAMKSSTTYHTAVYGWGASGASWVLVLAAAAIMGRPSLRVGQHGGLLYLPWWMGRCFKAFSRRIASEHVRCLGSALWNSTLCLPSCWLKTSQFVETAEMFLGVLTYFKVIYQVSRCSCVGWHCC